MAATPVRLQYLLPSISQVWFWLTPIAWTGTQLPRSSLVAKLLHRLLRQVGAEDIESFEVSVPIPLDQIPERRAPFPGF
jgi:hypothetical protein